MDLQQTNKTGNVQTKLDRILASAAGWSLHHHHLSLPIISINKITGNITGMSKWATSCGFCIHNKSASSEGIQPPLIWQWEIPFEYVVFNGKSVYQWEFLVPNKMTGGDLDPNIILKHTTPPRFNFIWAAGSSKRQGHRIWRTAHYLKISKGNAQEIQPRSDFSHGPANLVLWNCIVPPARNVVKPFESKRQRKKLAVLLTPRFAMCAVQHSVSLWYNIDSCHYSAIHSGCRIRDTWYLNHSVQQNSAGRWGINCLLTTSQIGCSLQVTSIKTYQTSTFCKRGILPKSGSISSKSDRLSTHWIPTYRSERALAWT